MRAEKEIRLKAARLYNAAETIQSHVRGFLARKQSVPKLEWHRKRLKAENTTRATHTRAHQAAMMISRPHKKDDCMRGCMYFIDQWSSSKECREAVTEASILHASGCETFKKRRVKGRLRCNYLPSPTISSRSSRETDSTRAHWPIPRIA